MTAGIYHIVNKVNGKKYIGSSIEIEKRWAHHKSQLSRGIHHNIHLQRAFDKYGEENFEFRIAGETLPEMAVYVEDYILRHLGDKFEYNIAPRAQNREVSEETKKKISENHANQFGENNPMYGKSLTDEHKRKISQSKTGKKLSEEHKQVISQTLSDREFSDETITKMSESKLGEDNPFFGKTHTEESRKKMSKSWTEERRKAYSERMKKYWAERKAKQESA